MFAALRIKNSLDAGSVRKVGDTIGHGVCIIFREEKVQRRVFVFKLNGIVAVKIAIVALFN